MTAMLLYPAWLTRGCLILELAAARHLIGETTRAKLGERQGQFMVAGGLNPENVGDAIRTFKPWGVDVVSGVEREPGRKDPEKLKAFVAAVRKAEQI